MLTMALEVWLQHNILEHFLQRHLVNGVYKFKKFRPGIISDVTAYSNEGGYIDGDKIRFRNGFPEKFGGWVKQNTNTYEICKKTT